MDWGAGNYETIAAQLRPAALALIEQAAVEPGEHVLDLGCGTGNAALLAAAAGAQVTGVDPAEGLLALATGRAAAEGLFAAFLAGEAAEIPLADSSADVIVSVFGVIFAPDARAAAAEIARVSAPRGRVLLSAWLPGGVLGEVMRVRGQSPADESAAGTAPPPFAWHDAGALDTLFAAYGFELELTEHTLALTAASPEEFLEEGLRDHPMWIAARETLDPAAMRVVSERALAILTAGNEQPGGFRVGSRYVVATLTHH